MKFLYKNYLAVTLVLFTLVSSCYILFLNYKTKENVMTTISPVVYKVYNTNAGISTATPKVLISKYSNLSKKICDSKINDAEKGKCYLQLAKETGDLGYCWKYQNDFNVCMKDVILYRHDPDLCNNLHPDSRVGCVKWYEGLDSKVK